MRNAIRRSAHATAVLLVSLRTAVVALLAIFAVPAVLVVLPLLPGATAAIRALANVERERIGHRSGHAIEQPYRPLPDRHWRRFLAVARDPALWRDMAWLIVHGATGVFVAIVSVGLWPAVLTSLAIPLLWSLLPPGAITAALIPVTSWPEALTLPFVQAAVYAAAALWLVPLAAQGQERLARSLLSPTSRTLLAERVERLTETRSDALRSHGAELRRIERDLHDGVQAQLVSVSVRLGLLERALQSEPDTAWALLHDARTGIEDSLGHLRGIVRGIYPPILADRGLGGAVHALAGGQRIPVTVRIPAELPRPAAPVEAAAYFVVAESLTNVTKHSTATHADITVERAGSRLRVAVHDDGQGGATCDGGTGLTGIRRRVAALDGDTHITSRTGEGTTVEVLLPCES